MFKQKHILTTLVLVFFIVLQHSAQAMESANYKIVRSVVNAAGNTYTGSGKKVYDSMAESLVGQTFGNLYSVQAGFFCDYFLPPPTATPTTTPTPTPTPQATGMPTSTRTPLIQSDFEGQIISKNYIYAAPNPVQGSMAKIYVVCKQRATGKIKIFTLLGQEVLSIERSFQVGDNLETIYVGNLPNAMYYLFVRVRNDEGLEERAKTKFILLQ